MVEVGETTEYITDVAGILLSSSRMPNAEC